MSVSTLEDLPAVLETQRGIQVAPVSDTGEIGTVGGGWFAVGHHAETVVLEAFNAERLARCQPLLLAAGERAAALRNLKYQYATVSPAGREVVLHRTDEPDTPGGFPITYLAD